MLLFQEHLHLFLVITVKTVNKKVVLVKKQIETMTTDMVMVIETVGALEVPIEEIEVGTKVVEVETAEEVREVSKVVEVMVIVIALTIKMVWNKITGINVRTIITSILVVVEAA